MRIAPIAALALFALLAATHGCSSSDTACSKDSDCSSSQNCAFPTGGGCGAKGVCKTWDNLCADPPQPSCGCNGKTVMIRCGYPGTPVPVKGAGYCPTPTGGACALPADCDPTALCAFPIADGCNAKGVCVAPDRTCNTPSHAGCGCDGNPIGIGCEFGPGNAVAPVLSMDPCPHDAGTSDAGMSEAGGD